MQTSNGRLKANFDSLVRYILVHCTICKRPMVDKKERFKEFCMCEGGTITSMCQGAIIGWRTAEHIEIFLKDFINAA